MLSGKQSIFQNPSKESQAPPLGSHWPKLLHLGSRMSKEVRNMHISWFQPQHQKKCWKLVFREQSPSVGLSWALGYKPVITNLCHVWAMQKMTHRWCWDPWPLQVHNQLYEVRWKPSSLPFQCPLQRCGNCSYCFKLMPSPGTCLVSITASQDIPIGLSECTFLTWPSVDSGRKLTKPGVWLLRWQQGRLVKRQNEQSLPWKDLHYWQYLGLSSHLYCTPPQASEFSWGLYNLWLCW